MALLAPAPRSQDRGRRLSKDQASESSQSGTSSPIHALSQRERAQSDRVVRRSPGAGLQGQAPASSNPPAPKKPGLLASKINKHWDKIVHRPAPPENAASSSGLVSRVATLEEHVRILEGMIREGPSKRKPLATEFAEVVSNVDTKFLETRLQFMEAGLSSAMQEQRMALSGFAGELARLREDMDLRVQTMKQEFVEADRELRDMLGHNTADLLDLRAGARQALATRSPSQSSPLGAVFDFREAPSSTSDNASQIEQADAVNTRDSPLYEDRSITEPQKLKNESEVQMRYAAASAFDDAIKAISAVGAQHSEPLKSESGWLHKLDGSEDGAPLSAGGSKSAFEDAIKAINAVSAQHSEPAFDDAIAAIGSVGGQHSNALKSESGWLRRMKLDASMSSEELRRVVRFAEAPTAFREEGADGGAEG